MLNGAKQVPLTMAALNLIATLAQVMLLSPLLGNHLRLIQSNHPQRSLAESEPAATMRIQMTTWTMNALLANLTMRSIKS